MKCLEGKEPLLSSPEGREKKEGISWYKKEKMIEQNIINKT
jgi:hypothetical protein